MSCCLGKTMSSLRSSIQGQGHVVKNVQISLKVTCSFLVWIWSCSVLEGIQRSFKYQKLFKVKLILDQVKLVWIFKFWLCIYCIYWQNVGTWYIWLEDCICLFYVYLITWQYNMTIMCHIIHIFPDWHF